MIDWEAYRLVLSIARCGRMSEAGRELGVTQSTMFRRLADLEAKLGRPLFHRDQGAYRPNEDGLRLVAAAENMEQNASEALRQVTGLDQKLRGRVTIAASEVLASFFLARHVAAIGQAHKGLEVSLLAGNQTLSLASLEADIAIRPQRPNDGALFGRKLATIRWAVYAPEGTADLASDMPAGRIGFLGDTFVERIVRSQNAHAPDRAAQFFSNSLVLSASLAASTKSEAFLPVILGEQWPGLVRQSDPITHDFSELWIVCHNDMRKNAKVRVVFDALIEAARADRALFEGTPSASQ
ncbi:LysR family transcriptional regulator [Nocardioides marinus]|nr:LysR family transcriptional regulator [Nocardioides marinus]